jgi:hypothetical protein
MQRRVQVLAPAEPLTTPPTTTAPPPVAVVPSATAQPVEPAGTSPDAAPPPLPPRRRVAPEGLLAAGVGLFLVGYVAAGVGSNNRRKDCHPADDECRHLAKRMMVPIVGPATVGARLKDPRASALAAFQGLSLALIVLGTIAVLHRSRRQRALDAHGIRISRNTTIRPDAGLTGGHISLRTSF